MNKLSILAAFMAAVLMADERAMDVEFEFGHSKTVNGVSYGNGTVVFKKDGSRVVGHSGAPAPLERAFVRNEFREEPNDTTVIRTDSGYKYFLVSYAGAAVFGKDDDPLADKPLSERVIRKECRWGKVYKVDVSTGKWEQGVYNVRSCDWDEKEDGNRWGNYWFLPDRKPDGEVNEI